MPTVSLNDTIINYLDVGSGTPLVFIHGLGVHHKIFEPQIEVFKHTHRVICPDLRGSGRSGTLTIPPNKIIDSQADDIALLIKHIDLKQVILCGVSYGGVIAFTFALRYPNLLKGLIVCDSFADNKVKHPMDVLVAIGSYLFSLAGYIPGSWFQPAIKVQYRKWPFAIRHIIPVLKDKRNKEFVLQCLGLRNLNLTNSLQVLEIPVLGIVGDQSKALVRGMKRAIKEIPKGRLEIIINSLDPSNLCQSKEFNQLVSTFCRELQG